MSGFELKYNNPALRLIETIFCLLLTLVSCCFAHAVVTDNADSLIIPAGETYTLDGVRSYNVSVLVEGTLKIRDYTGSGSTGVLEVISPSVIISSSGKITGDGSGYGGGSGPGAGKPEISWYASAGGGGGGYGGEGGPGFNDNKITAGGSAYGLLRQPEAFGSGGATAQDTGSRYSGAGGSGGGRLKLTLSGQLRNDGTISVNGGAGSGSMGRVGGGGGAGGSIYIIAGTLAGNGVISSNGGAGFYVGGGGSGGRIRINADKTGFAGSVTAYGGGGRSAGAAGTVLINNDLVIDNNNSITAVATPLAGDSYNFTGVTIKRRAEMKVSSFPATSVAGENIYILDSAKLTNYGDVAVSPAGNLVLAGGGEIHQNGGNFSIDTLNIPASGKLYLKAPVTARSLVNAGVVYIDAPVALDSLIIVSSGGIVTHTQGIAGFDLRTTGDITVEQWGRITGDGLGNAAGAGPGAGESVTQYNGSGGGGGGGSGGMGGSGVRGRRGGGIYGFVTAPAEFGSGGGSFTNTYWSEFAAGGSGGGKIRLTVTGRLSNNGMISANGMPGAVTNQISGGGGSGGSVYISAGSLAGNGVIAANGGGGAPNGGGGSGGRVNINVQDKTGFTGSISAYGGSGYNAGGAGTLFINNAELVVDNNNIGGGLTVLPGGNYSFAEVTVKRRAELRISSFPAVSVALNSLHVQEEGKLTNYGDLTVPPAGTVVLISSGEIYQSGGSFSAGGVSVGNFGKLYCNNAFTVKDLTVGAGGIITHSRGNAGFDLKVSGSLAVESGGRISADGMGHDGGGGRGAGESISQYNVSGGGGGGGYGGAGGNGIYFGKTSKGGNIYGAVIEPDDLGSGGGSFTNTYWSEFAAGGSGGGKIRLTVTGRLSNNGMISANGMPGAVTNRISGGGGSGGSVYIIADTLTGSGVISSNGGAGFYGGGGGGGGRIVLYHNVKQFNGGISANGGSGYSAGKTGTVLENGQLTSYTPPSADSPVALSGSTETISSQSHLTETIYSQKAALSNLQTTGTLQGYVNFTDFELVTIKTGAFSGKGFTKGNWTAMLDGVKYTGVWEGVVYLKTKENRIYLKGMMAGDIRGVIEGTLSESSAGSGNYDRYDALWSFNQINDQLYSGRLYLSGAVSYAQAQEYPSTRIKLLQTSVKGDISGYYAGPVNSMLTHLRIDDADSIYNGEGYAVISYVTSLGTGEGWVHARQMAGGAIAMNGLFDQPVYGLMQGILNENVNPRTFVLSLERTDVGLAPVAELSVDIFGPDDVSPGQTLSEELEVRNYGLKLSTGTTLLITLPETVTYISGSPGIIYSVPFHTVRWNIAQIPGKSSLKFNFQIKVVWGLGRGTPIPMKVYLTDTEGSEKFYGEMEAQWSEW